MAATATQQPTVAFRDADRGATKAVLSIDGTDVSHAFIIPMTIRIGVATVRMDGIGGVATDETHRHHGYSRRVVEAAVEHMRAGDAPLTTLYGIPRFYPKYGYATLGPESVVALEHDDLEQTLPDGLTIRAAQSADLTRIQTLYDDATRDAVGPVIRAETAQSWERLAESIEKNEDECRVVTDAANEVVGYAWRASWCWWMNAARHRSDEPLQIAEAFAASPRAADAVLIACMGWAREQGKQQIELMIPPEGPVALAAALRGATVIMRYTREGEFMGRSTGVADLMRQLQPELERRWVQTRPVWQGDLELRTGEDSVRLRLADDAVSVDDGAFGDDVRIIELSPGEVARLVFGSFELAESLARAGVSPDVIDILSVLFPHRFPYIYPPDRF